MEQRIRDRFNGTILARTAARYGMASSDLAALDGAESYIFAFHRDDADYILRLGHSIRRSVPLIQGEVDWMRYLHGHGAAVAQPILSPDGNLVELIDDGRGGHFLATLFAKAPGGPPRGETWGPKLFEEYGRVIGRMHRVTRDYRPSEPTWLRPQWDDPMMLDALDFLPSGEEQAHAYFAQTLAAIRSLPKSDDTYGLIHQDAHGGNFFVDDEGRLTFFDFDDCVYSWFANDIAIVLFYAVTGEEEPEAFAQLFLQHFLRGYRTEYTIDPAWLRSFPLFLKLREIDLYAVIHRSFDVENLDHPWVIRYMDGRKARIDSDTPYLTLDFAGL